MDKLNGKLRFELIAEEFKACRERIGKEIDFMNTLEATFILASGAIIAFVFTKDNRDVVIFRVAMTLIFLIGFYGLLRYNLHRKIIRIHETYTKEFLEPIIDAKKKKKPITGLVSYYDDMKSVNIDFIGERTKSGGLKFARFLLWYALIFLPIFAFAFSFFEPNLFGILDARRSAFWG